MFIFIPGQMVQRNFPQVLRRNPRRRLCRFAQKLGPKYFGLCGLEFEATSQRDATIFPDGTKNYNEAVCVEFEWRYRAQWARKIAGQKVAPTGTSHLCAVRSLHRQVQRLRERSVRATTQFLGMQC